MKEVCKDFFWKLNGNDHIAIADTEANRKFVAKKIIDMTEIDHMAETALKGMEKSVQSQLQMMSASLPPELMPSIEFSSAKKEKLKQLFINVFTEKAILNTLDLYVKNLTVSELLVLRAFNETSAGKKMKTLALKLTQIMMSDTQKPEFQRKVQAIIMS